jgi:hypothetical protein
MPTIAAVRLSGVASMNAAPIVATAKNGAISQSPVAVRAAFIRILVRVARLMVAPNAVSGQPLAWKWSGAAAKAHDILSSERNGMRKQIAAAWRRSQCMILTFVVSSFVVSASLEAIP